MVDWDQVERLRGKGWDWARIAEDDRVQFAADPGAGDAGRQLRTLYYQRRSKAQRRGSSGKLAVEGDGDGPDGPPNLLKIGYAVFPLFAIWTIFAFFFPSPVGVFLPWLDLAFIAIAAAAILLFALFRATVRWETALRAPLAIGIVLGLVATGTVALVAEFEGCPTLSPSASASEPNDWARYANPAFDSGGAPVFFFYGSIACPYCSASSWAMFYALRQFGTLSGWTLGSSNPGDVYPSTPEVELNSASLVSQWVNLQVYEGNDPTRITTPALPTCQLHSYVTTYDSTGTIPFVVIGGTFVHSGQSLISPTSFYQPGTTTPYSPQAVLDQVNNQSGPAWTAIQSPAWTIEAILIKLNGGNGPSSVTSDANVRQILTQLD